MKRTVVILGPLPPPYMGPTLATNIILDSRLKNEFNLFHFDTSDHRELNFLRVVDFKNIFLAFRHYVLLVCMIMRKKPDLIYIPISQTTIGYLRDSGFILISKLFGPMVVCHLRGGNFKNWYGSSSALTKFFIRKIHALVDAQIVLGKNLKYLFSEIIPKEKIYVVPNGKDIEFDNKYDKHPEKVRILFLSNFIREKGILDVLKAVPEVSKFNPNIEFAFAGNWRDENIRDEFLNISKKYPSLPFHIKGPVYGRDKIDLLSSSDIFVFPTYYPPEGHPWVIVEAMAAGLPIITTDQGAITESVLDGVNGFIVNKKSPEEIAEKIVYLLENPHVRKKMGEESRKLYLEKFTESEMVKGLSNCFNAVLS